LKILMTGATSQQIGNGTRLGYGPVIDLFRDALIDAGCEVHHRRFQPNDDLSEYDCAIVGQNPMNALTATYLYGALDVLGRARQNKVGLLLSVDDWQLGLLHTGRRTILRDQRRLAREQIRGARRDLDWAMDNLDRLMVVVRALEERPWPATIVPKFGWGDASPLLAQIPARRHVTVDPSSYATEYPTTIPDDQDRYGAWVLGILSDQREWVSKLGLSWPVSYTGGKKSKADQPMKEVDLVQRYAQCWGVLSPPYKQLFGTGWWRNRFVYAARTQGILYADPAEAGVIGDAYKLDPAEVEKLPVPQLRELADAQRSQLESWQWPKEQVKEVLMTEVQRAVEEARS
jgi:hypothetical protein